MKRIAALTLALGLGFSGGVLAASAQQPLEEASAAQAKVVYHINDSEGQALAALRNMRNQLDTDPKAKIVAVAHADGIEFMETDYKDADKVGPLISGLAARGVEFDVCEITMKRKKLEADDFVMEAQFVPSGVVRITSLQNEEGYAYIKP
ncbi:hypothetical protein D7I39_07200 [Allopusillimonas ginsengisoli]|nr:hypothetical protein D7I39_07200 [Allopusillimonas ginsengisoli]